MISSLSSGISGLNANAYAMAVARGKRAAGGVSAPGSAPQVDEYWTAERMRNAVPPDMGRVVPEPGPEPHLPEESERPEYANPGTAPGSATQVDEYWTAERMRNAVPPDMGRVVPEPGPEPHLPEESERPEYANPGTAPGSATQVDEYWTAERMRAAIPPDMGRVVPEPVAEDDTPEESEGPEYVHPGSAPGSAPQLDEYWTAERMRAAIPPDMGRVVPEPVAEDDTPEESEGSEYVHPGSAPGSALQFDEYWTAERMRNAIPPDMGRVVPEPGALGDGGPWQKYDLPGSAEKQHNVSIRA